MGKNRKYIAKIFHSLFGVVFVFAGVLLFGTSAKAAGDVTRYRTAYLQNCCPGIQVVAHAYLVGNDNVANYWKTIAVDKVPVNTKIQGKTIDPQYFPQDNIENLKQLYSSVQGYQNFTWISGAYLENEGSKLQVVAYDKNYIIYWSNGYRSFTESPVMCKQYLLMASHPPGFYRLPRSVVWLDCGRTENVVPTGETIKKEGTGRVTSSFIGISPIPGTADSGDVYKVKVNTELNVVSTVKLPSRTSDTTDTYYKISFNGKNDVNYMTRNRPGYYYVKSKYINLYRADMKTPSNLVDYQVNYPVTYANQKRDINVQAAANSSSEVLGYLQNEAQVQVYEKESNASWAAIYFNSQKAYVPAKYLKKVVKPVVQKPKNVPKNFRIKTIKNNQYVLKWDKPAGCKDYQIIYCKNSFGSLTSKKNVLYKNNHYKKNTITVKKSYLKKRTCIYIALEANYENGTSQKIWLDVYVPGKPRALKKKHLQISSKKIKIKQYPDYVMKIQYSTKKSFKKAKTVSNKGRLVRAIKKLKRNTTYYIRYCSNTVVDTDAGQKSVYGQWSKTLKVRTKG